jgi:hypothetical protein
MAYCILCFLEDISSFILACTDICWAKQGHEVNIVAYLVWACMWRNNDSAYESIIASELQQYNAPAFMSHIY